MRVLRGRLAYVRLAIVLLLALSAIGCGDDKRKIIDPTARRGLAEKTAKSDREAYRLYDADGELLESDQVIAGLRLPRGLELRREADRRHIYYSSVPLAKVQAYFGKRLVTGQVDRVGAGAIFRAAVPQGVKGGSVKMDVSILAASGKTRVEIHELPPPSQEKMTEAELELYMRDHFKRLD